jgi:nicotinamide-nucleotide amidase
MPPANARQAYLVEGATPIPNEVGTAPGQWLMAEARVAVLLPGPPSELHPMLEKFVLPRLRKTFPSRPQADAHLHFVGMPESLVDQRVRPLITRAEKKLGGDVQFTILAKLGLVDLDIFVTRASRPQAERELAALTRAVQRKMGSAFYGINDAFPLEKVVQDQFLKKRMTLALAESCTGGFLASRLTDIPGSSDYFLGSVVSYANQVKSDTLGVPAELLRDHGAVSRPVAIAMARGVRERLGATWGLSVTGIAGPGGGTPEKPVGLVFLAVAGPQRSYAWKFHFKGSRDAVRQRAVIAALNVLRAL